MADECTEEDGELVDVSKVSVPCDVASGRPVWPPPPDPWARVPLFGSQGDSLVLPTCEGL